MTISAMATESDGECLATSTAAATSVPWTDVRSLLTGHGDIGASVPAPLLLLLTASALYLVLAKVIELRLWHRTLLWIEYLFVSVPDIRVEGIAVERKEDASNGAAVSGSVNKKESSLSSLVDPDRAGKIQCRDPGTGRFLGEADAMTASDVSAACAAAAAAQVRWSKTTFRQRRTVLRTLQKYIVSHIDDICRACAADSGKPAVDAVLGEILTTTEKIRCVCAHGESWLQPQYRPTGPLMMHKIAAVEYVPMGVIGTIAPWNYPFHNMMNHIISGIFAGNAVVGKVSEHTSWSSRYFASIVRAALEANGHDPNLCQTVTGFGDAGAALVSDPSVDKIIFTGSPEIGRKVMETASRHLKPVILELGGKDAMVVMDDCKISEAVPWVMRGCFQNGGQNCVGIERVLVYESLYDEFVDTVSSKVRALRQGAPLEQTGDGEGEATPADVDCGALVMEEQLDKIQALVDDAVAKGARVLVGGRRNAAANEGRGCLGHFYEPTLLVDVTPGMRIFREEVFGPVMSVVKVEGDSDETCLELANGTPFGLGCSVYSGDQSRALRLGRRVRSGMLCVNDFGSNYLVQALPFGGVGESGFGRFAGPEGLRALCLERAVLTDQLPGMVRTTIPPALDYPMDKNRSFAFAKSLIELFYAESLVDKLGAIVGLCKNG